MIRKKIAFAKSLAGFGYLELRFDEVEASRFVPDVRGPAFGA
jgi:hypothetical protein